MALIILCKYYFYNVNLNIIIYMLSHYDFKYLLHNGYTIIYSNIIIHHTYNTLRKNLPTRYKAIAQHGV